MKNSFAVAFVALLPFMVSCGSVAGDVFAIGSAAGIDGLHAPWDGLDDETRFRAFCDEENLYFIYEVLDTTVTLTEGFSCEADVEPEDRVEIFLSPSPGMELYYCAEIDPLGRVLDYSCRYPSQMDYTWNFRTLEVFGHLVDGGYDVYGKISRKELYELGLKPGNIVYMGVFRADFRPDGSVNWYSHVETDDDSPFFHKPDMLFPAVLK
ncbi:MAG: hypothetical protein NC335_09195 [Bacteroides sp.]|nr:hypothetical protein [Bacteroides sp.]